ncbi:hypothetical protein H0H81_009794 [Sphagnurus paluster]|uniref:Uncharacterized protein n=1 Tax=Sphagnurus paluster TaxID=117069 RepID=A0A9P7K8J1_9AGAR|nr:hypothetical protein H0H81_009794 [Sphagnurus paluster]
MSLSDHFKTLPVGAQLSSLAIRGLQRQRKEIRREYDAARLALEKEFSGREQKLNTRRLGIIAGTLQPKPIELYAGAEEIEKEDEDYKPPLLDPSATSPIPDFWQTAICNHFQLSNLVTEKDIPALKSLMDVRFIFLSQTDPTPHFKLEFRFSTNDFFSNRVLEKTYYYKESEYGGFEPNYSVGTDIKWKRGKKLTGGIENDNEESSFFDFFTPPVPPESSDDDEDVSEEEDDENDPDEDQDSDDDEELEDDSDDESGFGTYEEALEDDFEMGEVFKDELVPDAIEWFMQEKEESSSEDSDWESNDNDNDDEDDDDDDDDDDDKNDDDDDDSD